MKGRPVSSSQLPRSRLSLGQCEHSCKRYTQKVFDYDTTFAGSESVVRTHLSCVCNEELALKNRHQFDDGARYKLPGPMDWRPVRKRVKPIQPWTEEQVIAHAPQSKRKLLLAAKESLKVEPLSKKDARIKMFLKDDKYHAELKDPRCIQYRNQRYNLILGKYINPIEEYMWTWKYKGTYIFAKGRNQKQRGRDIWAKMCQFQNPAVFSLDHSKWDVHYNEHLMRDFKRFCNECCESEELDELLDWQMDNSGCTKHGTRFRTWCTRMSGDKPTSCGNSYSNWRIVHDKLVKIRKKNPGFKFNYYFDGDDFIVVIEQHHAHLLDSDFSDYGMVTKLDSIAYEIEHVDFCQCRPVYDGDSYTMVRNPERMLARLPWVVGPLTPGRELDIIHSSGQCEVAQGLGLPVGQYIGHKMSQLGGKMVRVRHRAWLEKMKPGKLEPIEPAAGVRESYHKAWGLDVATQLYIESSILLPPEEIYVPGF